MGSGRIWRRPRSDGGEGTLTGAGRAIHAKRVTRVGYVVWVKGALADEAAEALAASVQGLVDRGAREITFDLTSVRTVDLAAVETFAAAALDGSLTQRICALEGGS